MEGQTPCFGFPERRVRLPKPPGDERRASPRYPLEVDLHYTVQDWRKQLETGNGRIVDLSSSGLRFTADRQLLPGLRISLAVRWPLLHVGGVQMQLVASGKIVWAKGNDVAIPVERHEFEHEEQD